MKTLAETICELSREHCHAGGLIMGQNLEAVQNVCGTVPIDEPNVQIMPTCEAAGMGLAVGAALTGRPVIHVIRFASFLWLQSSPLVYYAARIDQWGYTLPLWIRVSSDDGIGPTHSGAYHSPFVHMPGLKVVAPMTPGEYKQAWTEFEQTRKPVLVSEQRRAYTNALEMPTQSNDGGPPNVVIVAISAARFEAIEALTLLRAEGCPALVYHVWDLRPTAGTIEAIRCYAEPCKRVLVVDSTYVPCSVAEHIAFRVLGQFDDFSCAVRVLGMEKPPGVYEHGSPDAARIAATALEMCRA